MNFYEDAGSKEEAERTRTAGSMVLIGGGNYEKESL